MKKIRNAVSEDKKEFRSLWDKCFTDSIVFRDWFFENRFIPEYSICMGRGILLRTNDGRISGSQEGHAESASECYLPRHHRQGEDAGDL